MGKTKVCIIGLDGVDPDLLKEWAGLGYLPNFASIIKNGVFGKLKSTIPAVSAPAWVSFMTGKNPGKHNIFSFCCPDWSGKSLKIINSRDVAAKTIWRLASDALLKVGAINFPVTFPPEQINGFMVGCMLSPKGANFVYPHSLLQELEAAVGKYSVDADIRSSTRLEIIIKELNRCEETRMKAVRYLLQKYQCDLFGVVFTIADRMQHRFWNFHSSHKKDGPFKNAILDTYKKLDGYVGEIIKIVGNEAATFILSDHGFGSCSRVIYINKILEDSGLLYLKKGKHKCFMKIKEVLLSTKVIDWFMRITSRRLQWKILSIPHLMSIDWSRTKAYYSFFGGIYINLSGRNRHGIVLPGSEYEQVREKIIRLLSELKDPSSDKPLHLNVLKREDVYHGPFVQNAPDLIVGQKTADYRLESKLSTECVFGQSGAVSGDHALYGTLMAVGNGIKNNFRVEGAEIIDLAVSILAVMGIPVPSDMDGKILDIFKGLDLSNLKKSGEDCIDSSDSGKKAYTASEEEEIYRRLRSLGYLS